MYIHCLSDLSHNPLKCLGGPVPAKWSSFGILKDLPICDSSGGQKQDEQDGPHPAVVIIPIVVAVVIVAGCVWYFKCRGTSAMKNHILERNSEVDEKSS
jgi:hypothetical protein